MRNGRKITSKQFPRKGTLVHNGQVALNRTARNLALSALERALAVVNPYPCVRSHIKVSRSQIRFNGRGIPLSRIGRIFILSVGKAGYAMMKAAADSLAGLDYEGILVVPSGTKVRDSWRGVEVHRANHPYPGENGLVAAEASIRAARGLSASDLLICLISGGASALLPAPVEGITLHDKVRLTKMLIRSRATIHEINTVRRHISRLKGGRLAELCPAPIASLIISDVTGNSLKDIGSGLTAPDPTTFRDSVKVLKRHRVWRRTPISIRRLLISGVRGHLPETPKPRSPVFRKVSNVIVADNRAGCRAAGRFFENQEISSRIIACPSKMTATELGRYLAWLAHRVKIPGTGRAVIMGGEATLKVSGTGIGGRNQETALSALPGISGLEGTVVVALGTDGIDGNSPAAGAIADSLSSLRAKRLGLTPKEFLRRNDSYHFFRRLNDILLTGPTGTNVGDLYIMVRLAQSRGST